MVEPTQQASGQGGAADPPWLPPHGIRWLLRAIALSAATLAGVLFASYVSAWLDAGRVTGPGCGAVKWFDCDSVLGSRWARWFGVPVAGLGMALYAAVLMGLLMIRPGISDAAARRRWAFLFCAALTIILSAAWFVYVQFAIIGHGCVYCLAEHLVGLLLALLIMVYAVAAIRVRDAGAAAIAAVAAVGVLAGGQWLTAGNAFGDSRPAPPSFDGRGFRGMGDRTCWRDADPTLSLLGGRVRLDPGAHPTFGPTDAEHHVVEVIDYTCRICGASTRTIDEAAAMLGEPVAVVIVLWPRQAACNDYLAEGFHGSDDACDLARIAMATWLADADAFEPLHRWMMANQPVEPAAARAEAIRHVGEAALDQMLGSAQLGQTLGRHQRLALCLRRDGGLPRLIAGDRILEGPPDRADRMADWLAEALGLQRPAD